MKVIVIKSVWNKLIIIKKHVTVKLIILIIILIKIKRNSVKILGLGNLTSRTRRVMGLIWELIKRIIIINKNY